MALGKFCGLVVAGAQLDARSSGALAVVFTIYVQ